MRRIVLTLSLLVAPILALAETSSDTIQDIVDGHILPRFEALAEQTQMLAEVAARDCNPTSDTLRSAFGNAFDAWVSASHLRFGPTEVDDRAFSLAFWPDSRGTTPRDLSTLISEQDPIAASVEGYAQVSIAARGFYALEFLLYDDALMSAGDTSYHCQLTQTISADIALTASIILSDWQSGFTNSLQSPSPSGVYHSDKEVLQELLKSLSAGLQFTAETRLGHPLGTFDRPRPKRAEVHRSGRSSDHVLLSLGALQNLAHRLAKGDTDLAIKIDVSFEKAMSKLTDLNDPVFASVAEPQTRLKVEIIQQSVEAIRTLVRDELGPKLGVVSGFNALDGD